jgi:hypothetical protein
MKVKGDADFEYWAKMPKWNIHEAALLSLGKDPNYFEYNQIRYWNPSDLSIEYKRIKELVERSLYARCFGDSPNMILSKQVLPYKFSEWAHTNQIAFPEELAQRIDFYKEANRPKEEVTSPPVKDVKTRERETFLKIIIGMAVDCYGYDPSASRSTAIKDIQGALDRLGIQLSDDTIRQKLTEASEFFPVNLDS